MSVNESKPPGFWSETDESDRQLLKVAGGSNASKVAGALFKFVDEGKRVALLGIGAGAVNQMIKAVILGRSMAAQAGYDMYFVPGFVFEFVRGERKTAIKIYVRVER
jgi:stage V sporulation protein S